MTTPETYLGAARAERFTNPMLSPGLHDFAAPASLPPNEFAYRGRWRITLESATAAGGSSLDLNFGARRVYLVLGSPGRTRRMQVLLDGHPISSRRRRRRRPRRRRRRSPRSASTTSSTCPGSATTSSRLKPERE